MEGREEERNMGSWVEEGRRGGSEDSALFIANYCTVLYELAWLVGCSVKVQGRVGREYGTTTNNNEKF